MIIKVKTTDQMLKELGVGNIYIPKINFSPLSVIEEVNSLYRILPDNHILAKDMDYNFVYSYNGQVITYRYWNTDGTIIISYDDGITLSVIEPDAYVKIEREF